MKIELKELTNALSRLADLTAMDKDLPGILFNIRDDDIQICYTNGQKVLVENIKAIVSEEDIKGKIVFNYKSLISIIEACKPTGRIITDEVEFIFKENNLVNIKAIKKIPVTRGGEESYKVASVTDQLIGWTQPENSIKTKILSRENYDALLHLDDSEIDLNYKEAALKPIPLSKWEVEKDCWDIQELSNIMSKLSVESGKLIYIAPSSKKAFVENTACLICIPFKSEVKYKMIQSSSMAKAISSILNKIDTEDNTIYTNMIDDNTIVLSDLDNKTAFSLKNQKQINANILQLNDCESRDFKKYMTIFNRDVLLNCVAGAKTTSASDKIDIEFKEHVDGDRRSIKMVFIVKNTNSSSHNTYEIVCEHIVDEKENIHDIKLNMSLEILHQAINRIDSESIAFDISTSDNNIRTIRISEIDMEKRQEINDAYGISGGWTNDFMAEHREDMLGCRTFVTVSTN